MSAEEPLTERDKAVLGEVAPEPDERRGDHLDAQRAGLTSHDKPTVDKTAGRLAALEETDEKQQETVKNLTAMVNDLQGPDDGAGPTLNGLTLLEKYAETTFRSAARRWSCSVRAVTPNSTANCSPVFCRGQS